MSSPRISVVMATYNGERYLREAIESILQQTFRDFEFLILLDGSTDGSEAIVRSYAEQDARIRLIRNEQNMGLTRSLNKGLRLARGKYIARMDDDDVSLPDRFEKEIAYLEAHPAFVLCSCDFLVIDSEGRPKELLRRSCPPDLVRWYLMFYNYVGGHSQVMFRRDVALGLGGYDEADLYTEDYGLWQRMVTKGHIAILPEPLLNYRYHDKSISRQKIDEQAAHVDKLSERSVTRLLGSPLEAAVWRDLRALWIHGAKQGPVELPSPGRVAVLHEVIQSMVHAFVEQPSLLPGPKLRKLLGASIGSRFYRWAQYLPARRAGEKIRLLAYGGRWHPLGFPRVVEQSIQWRRKQRAHAARAVG